VRRYDPPIVAADATGTLTIDAADAAATADLAGFPRWHALVLHEGRPVARVDLAGPGRTSGRALQSAALLRWADWEATRDALVARLRGRMGLDEPQTVPPLAISVVVCTRRRPDDVRRLLAGLRQLDPAPFELIVVDNDPGEHDCEADARAAGARYVREDRRGLDNARNAAVAAARGDVVAFIDDDCVAPPGWLRRLPEELANPAVAGVTGPAFPHALDTPSRRRMEKQGSLARGLHRLEFDWLTVPIAGAGVIGVGANMAFRRAVLLSLGPQPFAPELDAGTATESGGDTYLMAKLLARGHRLVYDPATFVYHRHRADAAALHRAFFGYGVGLSAALAKLTFEDGELSAPGTWLWLLTQYRKTQQRRFAGLADAVETRLAWDYVRGGLLGPLRWRRALREARATARVPATGGSSPAAAAPSADVPPDREPAVAAPPDGVPAISVVVPTSGRPGALDRCLDALAAQDAAPGGFEVVVVDDSPAADAVLHPRHAERLRLRVLRSRGAGAAAARNAGAEAAAAPLLLFVDDDVIAEPGLVCAHLARHAVEGDDVAVVGPYVPRPEDASLASSAAALWWDDLFHALERAHGQTYLTALTGNMSISAAAFARSRGFDARFGRTRREDWEWGWRALGTGLSLRYEPAARARHEYRLDAPGRLRAAELEGSGDVLMLERHPGAASAMLPLASGALRAGGRTRELQRLAWTLPAVRDAAQTALGLLEATRLRRTWVRAFNAAQRLSYQRGALAAAPHPPQVEEPLLDVDLDGDAPIPPPTRVPPTIRVRVGGREVARVRPALGQWTPALADQIVDAVPWRLLDAAAAACGCRPVRDEAHHHLARTLVVQGPADDPAGVENLAGAGVAVAIAEGEPSRHWRAVLARAQAAEQELVAVAVPGVRLSHRALEEALVAFDGERVGAVLACPLSDVAPAAPLVLHERRSTGVDLDHDAVTLPWFAVVRRAALPLLADALVEGDPLATLHGLVERLLDDGGVVGYRDVHGLAGTGPRRFDGARALAAVRVLRSRAPLAAGAAEARRAAFLCARDAARGVRRRAAVASFAGTLTGLQQAWRRRNAPPS